MLVTLRDQRVEKNSHVASRTDLKLLIITISADPDRCSQDLYESNLAFKTFSITTSSRCLLDYLR